MGMVTLIGAGPGDAGYITVKGLEKLKIQHPDVYDDYVQTTENRRFAVKERKVA